MTSSSVPQFDGEPHRDELARRMLTVRRLLVAAHPDPPPDQALDISREVRGLAVVLLFASYENLLVGLCRSLLEAAGGSGVGNRELRPGFRLFAIHPVLNGICDTSPTRIWSDLGSSLMETLEANACTLNPAIFPKDGSFMRSTQVQVFCSLFELDDPGTVLKEVWSRLDTVVIERNGIAHGALSPEDVGRGYTIAEVNSLVDRWERRWTDFINHVELKASAPGFFRA